MAEGEGLFWVAPEKKASNQIYSATLKQKKSLHNQKMVINRLGYENYYKLGIRKNVKSAIKDRA